MRYFGSRGIGPGRTPGGHSQVGNQRYVGETRGGTPQLRGSRSRGGLATGTVAPRCGESAGRLETAATWLLSAAALGGGAAFAEDGLGGAVVEEGGVGVVEALELAAFDLLVDEALHGLGEFDFVGGEEGEGIAFGLGAAGAADAVHVVLGIFGDAVVDDVGDSGDVDAPCGDVGGDEDIVGAFLESLEGLHAVGLADVGVHDGDVGVAFLFEENGEGVGLLPGAGEEHDAVEVGFLEDGEEEFVALVHGDRIEGVGDGGGDGAAGDFHFDGILQAPFREGLDGRRHGGGEEEGLALAGRAEVDDLAHVGEEAHVEHAVDLVEDEGFDVTEIEGAPGMEVEEAAGGGDDDVGALFEGFDLLAVADAAIEEGDLVAAVLAVVFEGLGDLVGEFAGGLEDEADGAAGGFVLGEGGEGEGGGFAGAGLGGPDDVPAFQDEWNGLGLDGGRGGVAGLGDGFEDRVRQSQFRKQHGAR